MRQLFTSPRLENVEAVAQLLTDAGIEHKVSGGRSYKAYSRRQHSYTQKSSGTDEHAAIWIIKSDDYKRGREMLHELGLLDATHAPSYLPEALQISAKTSNDPQRRLLRIRIALLIILVIVASGIALRIAGIR